MATMRSSWRGPKKTSSRNANIPIYINIYIYIHIYIGWKKTIVFFFRTYQNIVVIFRSWLGHTTQIRLGLEVMWTVIYLN